MILPNQGLKARKYVIKTNTIVLLIAILVFAVVMWCVPDIQSSHKDSICKLKNMTMVNVPLSSRKFIWCYDSTNEIHIFYQASKD